MSGSYHSLSTSDPASSPRHTLFQKKKKKKKTEFIIGSIR